jgi:hypothetical protein
VTDLNSAPLDFKCEENKLKQIVAEQRKFNLKEFKDFETPPICLTVGL